MSYLIEIFCTTVVILRDITFGLFRTNDRITDRAVAQHCVNGDRPSRWKVASFHPLQNGSPGTSWWRYYHRWLRLRDNSLCHIWCRSSMMVLWQCLKSLIC